MRDRGVWRRQVILYCGAMTGSIRRALDETARRRELQARRRRRLRRRLRSPHRD